LPAGLTLTTNAHGEGSDSSNVVVPPGGNGTNNTGYQFAAPATCGNGVVDPGETCDPPGTAQAPNGNPCRTDCTFCGDGIVNGPSGVGHETCDDANSLNDDECTNSCRGTIHRDPATIIFRPDLSTDRFKATGRINTDRLIDPSQLLVGVTLLNANGVIYTSQLPIGSVIASGHGRRFKFRDRSAHSNPAGGIAEWKLSNHSGWYSFKVAFYGDLSAATLADMTLVLSFGSDEYVSMETWTRTNAGWKVVFLRPSR